MYIIDPGSRNQGSTQLGSNCTMWNIDADSRELGSTQVVIVLCIL